MFDAGALLVLVSELTSARGLATHVRARWPAWLSIATLLASYAAQLAVLAYAVHHQAQQSPNAFLPLPLTGAVTTNQNAVTAAMLALAALQTYALLQLYRAGAPPRAVVAGSAVLLVLSLLSPAMISADAYAYVADALLGRLAYAPPAAPFGGEYAVIGAWWKPLPPTPYGPLWLASAWLVTAPFASLLGKIAALRGLGAAAFVALPLLLRALGLPPRIVAIAALNPALAFEFVAGAHNDLFGIVLLLAAAFFARRRPAVAALLLVAGALVKLPFAILGLPALAALRSRAARVAACVCIPAAAFALSWLAGGAGFVAAMRPHLATSAAMAVLTSLVAAVVLAASIAAVFRARRLRAMSLLAPLASAYSLAWYVAWGLPYASGRRTTAAYLLLAFPLAAMLLEVKFMTPWTLFAVVPAIFAWQILAVRAGSARRPRHST